MKRFFSIFFLVILSLQIGGFYAILRFKQALVRKEMKEKIVRLLPNTQLKCIEVWEKNKKVIIWEKENKEFWYKQELFDIVRIEKKTNSILYYCISDKDEARIIAQIKHIEENQNSDSPANHSSKLILKFVFSNFTIPTQTTLDLIPQIEAFPTKNHNFIIFYTSQFPSKTSPPPQV